MHGLTVDANGTTAYVTNVVKCRPPHGRMPQPAELARCAQYLQRELALVQPKVILAMGRIANQVLLGEGPGGLAAQPLGKLRGTVHRYAGVAVVVTYHPKVLMRSSADKAKAWADLCLAAELVDAAHIQSHHDRTT
jgi:DNA polymerase